MAYQIDNFAGTFFITVDDQTVNSTAADLRFVGRNYSGYGEIQNENFLHLLENFSNTSQPPRALTGQLWFDSRNNKLKVYDGTRFKSVAGAEASDTIPSTATLGDLWLDTRTNQVKVYDGTEFILVGPDLNPLFGPTSALPVAVKDSFGNERNIIKLQVDGDVIAIISKEDFILNPVTDFIPGFSQLKIGITLNSTVNGQTITDHRYWGTASNADKLNGFGSDDFIKSANAVFSSRVSFPDSGITVGDQNDIRIAVVNGIEAIIENQLNLPFSFRVSNNGLDAIDILTITASGAEPGSNGLSDLGSVSSRWRTVFTETLNADHVISDEEFTGSGIFNFTPTALTNQAEFTVNLLGSTGQISLVSGAPGSIENINIGTVTPQIGRFTVLSATNGVRFTSTAASVNASSGALVVSGGVGIGGDLSIAGNAKFTGEGAIKVPVGPIASRPVPEQGMLRFNDNLSVMEAYDGSAWVPLGNPVVSLTPPSGSNGNLWLKEDTKQLYVFYNQSWSLIGPEVSSGYGKTRLESGILKGSPVVFIYVNEIIIGVVSNSSITDTGISFLPNIVPGINLSSEHDFSGSLNGNAATASRLANARLINGTPFDGQNNITITSNTTRTLKKGNYLTGLDFNGSTDTTWSVNASTSGNNNVVARDTNGNFSAGTITATLNGNASTATKFKTARTINGVSFDGSSNITVADSTKLALSGGTMTGAVTLAIGSTGGIKWPNNAYGGSGDTASITLQRNPATSGENTRMTFTMTNDSGDQFAFVAPSKDGMTMNGFTVLNTGNMKDYIKGTWNLNISGNASTATTASNASKLDNYSQSTSATNNSIARRDSSGRLYAKQLIATDADLAEKYLGDRKYEKGTVVEFGGDEEITLASEDSTKVAGIVSSNPGLVLNEELIGENVLMLALQGRVPCKVLGKVEKGDMMVSAGNGFAKSSKNPKIGSVIGKSLENFDGQTGVIEIAIGRF